MTPSVRQAFLRQEDTSTTFACRSQNLPYQVALPNDLCCMETTTCLSALPALRTPPKDAAGHGEMAER